MSLLVKVHYLHAEKFSMIDCMLCTTSVCDKMHLFARSRDLLPDIANYRQLVGSLQYLTFTKPHIAYDHVAQF